MQWQAWVTLATIGVVLFALVRSLASAEMVLLAALTVLMTLGSFFPATATAVGFPSPREAVESFGNQGLVTVAVLFVVAAGLTQTGAMSMLTAPLLGRPSGTRSAQARLMFPVAALSALLNNTPLVMIFMPVVNDWCKRTSLSASKLFIPLSYAAILGGTCSLIGTSTNLVVNGMLLNTPGQHGLGMFDIAWIGVPITLLGLIYILVAGKWLLPDRRPAISSTDDPRQYTVEMLVEPGSAVCGQTIEGAGLRHLPGLFLAEIERNGEILAAVGPDQVLRASDRLVFVGVVESVVDLQKIRGLLPATNQVFKLDAPRSQRCLIEAVISDSNPLVGRTIRAGRFRSVYNAAVIAVARGGERMNRKIGDIVVQPGDTLLLEAAPTFVDQQRNARDFFLVSRVEGAQMLRHDRAWLALAILGAMVAAVTAGALSMLVAATIAAGLMIATRCCSSRDAMRAIDWPVVLVIGAALGLGKAIQTTGAAGEIATGILSLAGNNPWLVLAMVYVVTMIFTEMITNNAAAVLVFPIALNAANTMNVNFTPFVITIMVAASASFITPIGYQTNLMVLGPGGYRFSDYPRIGAPLSILVGAITVVLAPLIWPFV